MARKHVQGTSNKPLAPVLSPREQQAFQLLLAGASEKEAAVKMGVSPNTVHVYVKRLYRHFGVSSRGERMAKCLG